MTEYKYKIKGKDKQIWTGTSTSPKEDFKKMLKKGVELISYDKI